MTINQLKDLLISASDECTMTCKHCGGIGKEPDPRKIGAALRGVRKEAKITLLECSRRMNVSAAYLSDLELGKRGWNSDRIFSFQTAIITPKT